MEKNKSRWQILEAHLIKWLLGLATTSIVIAVGFYFNTNHVLAQNTTQIKEIKEEVKKIKIVSQAPALNTLKINQLAKEIAEHKETSKELSVDLKDFKKQYDQDKILIIQLLMEIKSKQNN